MTTPASDGGAGLVALGEQDRDQGGDDDDRDEAHGATAWSCAEPAVRWLAVPSRTRARSRASFGVSTASTERSGSATGRRLTTSEPDFDDGGDVGRDPVPGEGAVVLHGVSSVTSAPPAEPGDAVAEVAVAADVRGPEAGAVVAGADR